MRKLIVFLLAAGLVFVFSAPAPAEDKTVEERVKALEDTVGAWSFYGSVRFATFFQESSKNFSDTEGAFNLEGPDQKTTQWGIAGNSRLGATVNKGDFSGRVELGLKENQGIGTRLIYGTYTFNNVTLLVGQDYAPLSDWGNSNQVFYWDQDMAGWGIMDESYNTGGRIPQIKIKWRGFQVAFVETKPADGPGDPNISQCGLDGVVNGKSVQTAVSDVTKQAVLPHLEVKYSAVTDKFFGDVFGGAGTYKIKAASIGLDRDINSYAVGINGGVTISPIYANATVWTAENGKQMGLHQADSIGAVIDSTSGKLYDDREFGWAAVVGVNIQKVTVEAGYGFVKSHNSFFTHDDDFQTYYLQAVIPVAANKSAKFSVTPEIGWVDYMKDFNGNPQGSAKYAGVKSQIDF